MTKLYRSTRDKKIFGLCGGLAEAFNIDATILRLIVAIGVVFSGGTVLLLYIVACMVIPKEPYGTASGTSYNPNAWYNGSTAHTPPQSHVPPQPAASAAPAAANIDEMMKDIEKKAMQKEIEELRARLAKLEKGDE